jgi:hypothetical protein
MPAIYVPGQNGPVVYGKASAGLGLQTNCSAFWELENTSWTDAVGSNNLTGNGTPTPSTTTGVVGNGVNIVGANAQFLSHADTTALNMGGKDFSIQFWFNSTTSQGLLGKDNGGFANIEWHASIIFTSAHFLQCEVNASGGGTVASVTTSNSPAAGFNHAVMTFNNTSKVLTAYLNNVATSTTGANSIPASTSALWIGKNQSDGQSTGPLDQIGMWQNRVLSSGDVSLLYNSGSGLSWAAMA